MSNDSDFFEFFYEESAAIARALVNRAIDDWEQVIESFNYTDDGNLNTTYDSTDTFTLTLSAGSVYSPFGETTMIVGSDGVDDITHEILGKPIGGTVALGQNAAGFGWFFDPTPLDDAEFTGLSTERGATFVDTNAFDVLNAEGNRVFDFYTVVLHEIGHTLGFYGFSNFQFPGYQLWNNAHLGSNLIDGNDEVLATLKGPAHLDPVVHPDFVMSEPYIESGLPAPRGTPEETMRLLISDLEAQILREIYGYTVKLPSTFKTAHATLDSQTGTLLVQGLPDATNEDIILDLVDNGDNIEVKVGNTQEKFPTAEVTKIVIAKNGGGYDIDVKSPVSQPWQKVQYVVSSNQDAAETGTLGDGLVDLAPANQPNAVPGNQVTLRATVQDANGVVGTANRSIYVPRGNYDLHLTGSGGASQGDFDVSSDMTVIGSGAGSTVINAFALMGERAFDVNPTGSLRLERLTLTGGWANEGAAVRVEENNNNSAPFALSLQEIAIAFNANNTSGGALYVGPGSTAEVVRSVITNDHAAWGGGGIYAAGGTGGKATVWLEESIIAKNYSSMSGDPDLMTGGSGTNEGEFISRGNNLIGEIADANFTPLASDHEHDPGLGDYYVVTSLVDTFDHGDDNSSLSLREAINLANINDDTLEEIWLPAWDFFLTRKSSTPGAFDNDIAFGDLEISDMLTIRGAGSAPVQVSQNIADYQDFDPVFDLLGDFTGDGTVEDDGDADGRDFLTWQGQTGSSGGDFAADADDDGDVDGDDLAIWQDGYGDTLNFI